MRRHKPAIIAAICFAAFAGLVAAAINHPGDNAFDTTPIDDPSLAIDRSAASPAEKLERKRMTDVEEFVRGLHSPDREERIYSINAITYLGPGALRARSRSSSLFWTTQMKPSPACPCGRSRFSGPPIFSP